MVAYYGKLKTLWNELANYEQIPKCSCGGCKCDITSQLEKQREEEKVHQFLMGLDDVNYSTVRSNILATDPLPSMNKVYSTLVQEERNQTITRAKVEKDLWFRRALEPRDAEKERIDQLYVQTVARPIMMLDVASN